MSRYAGRIGIWDVVNEAIAEDGSFRDSLWYRTIGPEYIGEAFRAARQADPDALLFYNDYGVESTPEHAESVYSLVRTLLMNDVPIDGIGLQMHLQTGHTGDLEERLPTTWERFAGLNLRLHITELDVRIQAQGQPTQEQLEIQACIYGQVLRSCLNTPRCDALVLWGFADRYSWVPYFFADCGSALIFDYNYRKKPSYEALAAELKQAQKCSLKQPGGEKIENR
jgi:endo-1,4-beta-xylanase